MSTVPESHGPKQGSLFEFHYEFNGHRIRCGGTRDNPWFVAQDACDVLDIADASSALRAFPDDEKGVQVLRTPGGRQRALVVYESGLYRLIFRSNKPDAEQFRRWVFHEVLPAIRRTGEYSLKRRQRYERLGRDQQWIENREQGIESRKDFTATLQQHGVEGGGYGIVTNAIYWPILGGDAQTVKRRLGLPKNASLRDNLPRKQLVMVTLSEITAQEKIQGDDQHGTPACKLVAAQAANHIANAVKRIEGR